MLEVIKKRLLKIKPIRYYVKGMNISHDPFYSLGKNIMNDPLFISAQQKAVAETKKKPSRTEIINFILTYLNRETTYLEIGTRNPYYNFDKIEANIKYSVDPGVEFEENPVDFRFTSDDFFKKLDTNEILSPNIKFDVIFIDGLHLADQVNRDIFNAMNYIKEDGFIILHDCNPPTEWHARIEYNYRYTPAGRNWNGTTWKAFLKWRGVPSIQSCCIDSDWGVGVISKKQKVGDFLEKKSLFYEFIDLENNRVEYLNLIRFDDFKRKLMK